MKTILLLSCFVSSALCRENESELIFIYNAKSGIVNEFLDFARKIVSPNTHNCNLCAISYGNFTMEKKWSNYISSLPVRSTFTYKDKVSQYGYNNIELPSIIFRNGSRSKVIISSEEINKLKKIDQLINILSDRLKDQGMSIEKQNKNNLSEQEWKEKLTPEEYHILREKGTERPFTGEYDKFYEDGTYKCAGCGTELFSSSSKYDSGCGWPAFYEALPEKIEESEDNSFGMKRIEITCENCGGHLGHVFNDGPKPSGLRYCVNSISLDFDSGDDDND
jgi:peptide-methionine (R)-S-oxide reductase